MTYTFRLTENTDPEERLEEASLWKALVDEYGSAIRPATGDTVATFGRRLKQEGGDYLPYWDDPAFLQRCNRRFSVVAFDKVITEVARLHSLGLGAFLKSTRAKHWVERIPLGTDAATAIGEMAYSFMDGGPLLMVQELVTVESEHRFFVIDRKVVTFSESRPELTPLDFPKHCTSLPCERLRELTKVAFDVAVSMKAPSATVDIAFINGAPAVVEFNPLRLGQVGLFACDVRALARASRKLLASADTHPKGGDAQQAPSPMGSAVPQADAQELPHRPNAVRHSNTGDYRHD